MVKSTTSLFMFSKELRHTSSQNILLRGEAYSFLLKSIHTNCRVENFFTEIKKNMNYMKKVTKTKGKSSKSLVTAHNDRNRYIETTKCVNIKQLLFSNYTNVWLLFSYQMIPTWLRFRNQIRKPRPRGPRDILYTEGKWICRPPSPGSRGWRPRLEVL